MGDFIPKGPLTGKAGARAVASVRPGGDRLLPPPLKSLWPPPTIKFWLRPWQRNIAPILKKNNSIMRLAAAAL